MLSCFQPYNAFLSGRMQNAGRIGGVLGDKTVVNLGCEEKNDSSRLASHCAAEKRNQTGWDTHRARRPYAAILRWDGNGCPPACTHFGNKATGGMHDGRTYGGNFSACIKNYQQKQTALAPLLVNRKRPELISWQ